MPRNERAARLYGILRDAGYRINWEQNVEGYGDGECGIHAIVRSWIGARGLIITEQCIGLGEECPTMYHVDGIPTKWDELHYWLVN